MLKKFFDDFLTIEAFKFVIHKHKNNKILFLFSNIHLISNFSINQIFEKSEIFTASFNPKIYQFKKKISFEIPFKSF